MCWLVQTRYTSTLVSRERFAAPTGVSERIIERTEESGCGWIIERTEESGCGWIISLEIEIEMLAIKCRRFVLFLDHHPPYEKL